MDIKYGAAGLSGLGILGLGQVGSDSEWQWWCVMP